jgi:hypothetical protein
VTPPQRLGFGSRLLRRLKGELKFAPKGLTCLIRLPTMSGNSPVLSH